MFSLCFIFFIAEEKLKKNIVKLLDKYPKMLTSSITLDFLKSYFNDIKSFCFENPKLFS